MISVIMPAYNSQRFIAEAIESILNQTCHDFELIILDDGSTDETRSIACTYTERDPRVKVVTLDHGGLIKTLNIGVRQARYDWIARMDADDVSLPSRLEKQVAAAKANPKVVAWGTYAYHINGRSERKGLSRTGPTTEEQFCEMRRRGQVPFVIHPTALIRKEAISAVGGYDPLFDMAEDIELFDRLATLGPILALPEPLYLKRVHAHSITSYAFFANRTLARYVRARQTARATGAPLPPLQDFLRQCQKQPVLQRIRRRADDLSQYCYRKAAVEYADANFIRFLFYFGISTFLNPSYALKRVCDQKLSRVARRWMTR
jgi:glycosyltransferase involved in cell wall biosynthesis